MRLIAEEVGAIVVAMVGLYLLAWVCRAVVWLARRCCGRGESRAGAEHWLDRYRRP